LFAAVIVPKRRIFMQYQMQEQHFSRLFGILSQLSPHSQVTVHDLAAEYEVNERTIQRDIDVLQQAKLGVFYDINNAVKISRVGYGKIKSWIVGAKDE